MRARLLQLQEYVGMSFFTGAFMRLCSSATASNACKMNIVTNANASENSIEFMYVQNIGTDGE